MGQSTVIGHLPDMTDVAVGDATELEATVRRAAEGDATAFAHLVAAHHASMMRVAYVIVGDAAVASDAAQAAWAIAWQRLGGLRDPAQVRAWLVAIAANEARQALRRGRRRPVVDLSASLDQRGDGDPAESIGLVDLERALRRLKPEERSLIALRYVAGLDSTEIAAQLGGSASGVRSRLSRILDRLRTDLDHD
jgi:RNA polymerase sigma-70 factor (ECF subfamily)